MSTPLEAVRAALLIADALSGLLLSVGLTMQQFSAMKDAAAREGRELTIDEVLAIVGDGRADAEALRQAARERRDG